MTARRKGGRGGGAGRARAEDPAAAVERLVAEIRRHDELYYQLDRPAISDAEYDALFAELERLEAEHPRLRRPDSPTQRVGGAPVAHLAPRAHRRPMLSLANTYTEQEVLDWRDGLADFLGLDEAARDALVFSAEPKLDGVAIELVYEEGELTAAITRGDGRVGDDVTHIVRTIRGLPHALDASSLPGGRPPALLEVRGEVIMTRAAFEALNRRRAEAGEELFINPRNTASGTLKSLDPAVTRQRPLTVICYGLGATEGLEATGHADAMDRLQALGLATGAELRRSGTLDRILAHHAALGKRRDALPCDVDGTVIKLDDAALQRRLGVRSRSPRWAIAYKFPARQGTSIVREIQVLVGRTGALTPRAVVDPVHVAGVTIEHVSLHNRDEIERLGVKVGDRVVIERAGDVIPHVVAVSEDGGGDPFVMPRRCPACGSKVVEAPDEVVQRCPNRACPAVLKRRIEHYVGRGALDIEGMGTKLVDQLVEKGLVRSLADLYELDADTLADLERMGEQSAANVMAGLEASKGRPFARWLYGMGIRHVGEHVAEVVAGHWGSLEELRGADEEALQGVAEIGPTVAASLAAWLDDEGEQADVDRMVAAGLQPAPPGAAARGGGALAGRTFLFTGALQQLSRREAQELVKAAGGRLLSGVSSNLDVLVVGDKPGSKLKRAQELGVQVMDEEAFLALVGRGA